LLGPQFEAGKQTAGNKKVTFLYISELCERAFTYRECKGCG